MNISHNFEQLKEIIARIAKDNAFRLQIVQNPQLAFEGFGLSPVEQTRVTDLALNLGNRRLALNTTTDNVMSMYTANPWG